MLFAISVFVGVVPVNAELTQVQVLHIQNAEGDVDEVANVSAKEVSIDAVGAKVGLGISCETVRL